MADENKQYAVIFDPENGLQILDVQTNEVADLAVLEGTWRANGQPPPENEGAGEADVRGLAFNVGQLQGGQSVQPLALRDYGGLRIRSTGAMPYAIASMLGGSSRLQGR